MSDPIHRIEEAIAELGAEYEPPVGWEARVLAAVGVRKRRWWWLAGPVATAAAAAAIAIAVWPRQHDLRLAIDVEAGGGPVRGSSARVGDVLHARATDGTGHRALWVYRDDALVVACPGAPGCRSTGDALGVDLALDSIGKYVVVALSSSAALPVPAGAYDDDVASALRAGATKQDQAVTVH